MPLTARQRRQRRSMRSSEVIVPSSARTANGQLATAEGWGGHSQLAVKLNVTAKAGTAPSVQLIIEDSADGNTWNTLDTFPTQTDPAVPVTVTRTMPRASNNFLRARWVIGGSAGQSLTFSVTVAANTGAMP